MVEMCDEEVKRQEFGEEASVTPAFLPAEKSEDFVGEECKYDDKYEEGDEADESDVVGESIRNSSFERFYAFDLFLPSSSDESFFFVLNGDGFAFSDFEAFGKDGFRGPFTRSFCNAMGSLQHRHGHLLLQLLSRRGRKKLFPILRKLLAAHSGDEDDAPHQPIRSYRSRRPYF